MERLKEIGRDIFSIIVAVLRLLLLTCTMFISSLNLILFAQLEIVNVELKGQAWRSRRERDMRTLAFLDKVMIENPELLDYAEQQANEPPQDIEDDEEDEGNEE